MIRLIRAVGVALFACASAASAMADGYAPTITAPVAEVPIWTGAYVNGGVGYGLWDAETTTDIPGFGCFVCSTTDHGGRGWLGEVGLGYDYQWNDKIVVGALLNFDFSGIRGNLDDGAEIAGKSNNDWSWFIGARAGWLMNPSVLNYWSIGYTQAHFSQGGLSPTIPIAFPVALAREDYTAGGWFIGGGLEVAMHDGWFWRSEVRYADYGKKSLTETVDGAPFAQLNFNPVVETATTEIVYKLDWLH